MSGSHSKVQHHYTICRGQHPGCYHQDQCYIFSITFTSWTNYNNLAQIITIMRLYAWHNITIMVGKKSRNTHSCSMRKGNKLSFRLSCVQFRSVFPDLINIIWKTLNSVFSIIILKNVYKAYVRSTISCSLAALCQYLAISKRACNIFNFVV
jgi:hypothetical protein